jgi:hypothetical protein
MNNFAIRMFTQKHPNIFKNATLNEPKNVHTNKPQSQTSLRMVTHLLHEMVFSEVYVFSKNSCTGIAVSAKSVGFSLLDEKINVSHNRNSGLVHVKKY